MTLAPITTAAITKTSPPMIRGSSQLGRDIRRGFGGSGVDMAGIIRSPLVRSGGVDGPVWTTTLLGSRQNTTSPRSANWFRTRAATSGGEGSPKWAGLLCTGRRHRETATVQPWQTGRCRFKPQRILSTRAHRRKVVVMASDRFLTLADVAEILNISTSQAYALVRSGELVGIQIGGRNGWRVERARLEAYIEQAYQRSASALAELPAELPAEVPTEAR